MLPCVFSNRPTNTTKPATMPHLNATKRLSKTDVAQLVALTMACPVEQNNPADCPLNTIRQLPLKERFEWAKSRTPEEAKSIFERHLSCHRQDISTLRPR